MRNHHDGLAQIFVQTAQHLQHNLGIFRVKIAGRLVCQQNFRFVDDRAGDCNALLFAARHLGRLVSKAAFEPEHFRDNIKAVRIEAVAMYVLRNGDVAPCAERRKKIEALKDKADFTAAKFGPRRITHFRQIVAIDQDFAA